MDKVYTSYCKCGCNNAVVFRVDQYDDDKCIDVSLVSDKFYTEQLDTIGRIKEKIKQIWCVITNKEYCYFDIVIDKNEVEKFKEFVNKL